jgi:hypothetical protein
MCSSKHTAKIVTFSDMCNTFPDYLRNLTFPVNIANSILEARNSGRFH